MSEMTPKRRSFLRRWTRRAFKAAIWGVVLLLIGRISLPFVLPVALDKIAGHFGFHAEYEALKLRFSDGGFELWGLRVGPRGDGETPPPPFLTVDYASADLELRSVFSGRPRLRRASADGVTLTVERRPSGEWTLLEALAPLLEGSEESPPEPEEETEGGYPLELPFELTALRVDDAVLKLDDQHLSPPLSVTLSGDLRLTGLGNPGQDAKLAIHCRGAELFDSLVVEGEVQNEEGRIGATLGCELHSMRPGVFTEYLAALGIEPVAEEIDLHGQWRTELSHTDETHEELAAELRFEQLSFEVDLEEHFALDEFVIEVGGLSGTGCSVSRIAANGLRGRAERTEAGRLRVAGFELGPATAPSTVAVAPPDPEAETETETAEDEVAAVEEPAAPEVEAAPESSFAFEVAKIEVAAGSFHFVDLAMQPAVELDFSLDGFEVTNIVADAARPDERAGIAAEMRLPGIVESITVTGDAGATWPNLDLALGVDARGIAPDRLAPYLATLGIESTWESGHFQAGFSAAVELHAAGVRAEVAVTDLELNDRDGEEPLLAIGRIGARGIDLAPAEDRFVLGELELAGTRFFARRDAERAFRLLGFRVGGTSDGEEHPAGEATVAEASPEAAPPTAATGGGGAASSLPHLEITSVHWLDTRFEFVDETLGVHPTFVFDDLEAKLSRLIVGGREVGAPRPPAGFELHASLGELASSIEVTGDIRSHPGRVELAGDLHLEAEGLSLAALQPYLEELLFEPTLENGRVVLDLEAGLAPGADGLEVRFALRDVELAQGNRRLAGLGRLEVRELGVTPERIRIGAIEIAEPYFAAELDSEGAMSTFGVRILPRIPPDGGQKRLPRLHELVDLHALEAAFKAIALGEGPRLQLDSLRLDALSFDWADGRVEPRVETNLALSAGLTDLLLGAAEKDATFEAQLRVGDSVEELRASGNLLAAPRHLTFRAEIEGRGLRVGSLKGYLPPGIEGILEDGRLHVQAEGELSEDEEGEYTTNVTSNGLDFREANSPTPLLAFTRIAADAPRIDAETLKLEFGVIECVGLEAAVHRASATSWEAMGIAVDTEVLAAAREAARKKSEEAAAAAEAEEASASVEPATTAPPLKKVRPPRISIEKLQLELASLRLSDATRPEAAPVELALRLETPEPLVLLDEHPEELPPFHLEIGGAVKPLIEEFTVVVDTEPFVPDPRLRLQGTMSGLRGAGLTELVPELAQWIDGSGLENGEATGSLELTLHARRRGPFDFDWSSGFGLDADLGECVLLDGPDGEELLGLGGLLVDVRRVRPRNNSVHIAEIDIIGPRGAATRVEGGIRVAGLLVKTPEAEEVEPGSTPAVGSETTEIEEVAAVEDEAPTDSPSEPAEVRDLRVDRFYVSGLDLTIADEVVEPPLLMPLNDVDLAVIGLSTRAMQEGRPVRFRTIVSGGEISIPARDPEGKLVELPANQKSEWPLGAYEVETRPAFDELSLVGEIAVKPELLGRAKINLWGLELLNAAGSAREFGIDIHDGVLDSTIELHLSEERGLNVEALSTFTWLSLSENEGGPIRSTLALPAPIDTVIFMTRNVSGENKIPISFTIPAKGLDGANIMAAVTSTVAQVIASSIARSPFRLVGGALDFGGILGGETVPKVRESVTFQFQPGTARLHEGEREQLGPLIEMLAKDSSLVLVVQHELGGGDHDKAEQLANPDPATCQEFAEGLRRTKAELLHQRDLLAAEVRAMYALEEMDRAETLAIELRELEAQLGRTEEGLEQLFGLLRPGADRRRDRRTKAACLSLARQRLGTARSVLSSLPLENIENRVDIRRPRFAVPEEDGLGGRIVITPVRR